MDIIQNAMAQWRPSAFVWTTSCLLLLFAINGLRKLVVYNRECYARLRPSLGNAPICGGVDSIRVLSQNMWAANFWAAERLGSKGPHARQRFDGLVRAAIEGKYDVLLLQELFVHRTAYFFATVEEVTYLTQQLEEAGFTYHTDLVYNLPRLFGQSSGVAIFSKHPISEWKGHTFSQYSVKEVISAKGFVHAMVAVGRSRLHLFSTHMDSSRWEPTVRLRQVSELASTVNQVIAASGNVAIVAGDFNIDSLSVRNQQWYSHLVSTMSHVGMETVFSDLKATFHSGGVLDHVFVGGTGFSVNNVTAKHAVRLESGLANLPVSDHYGLSFTVKLPRNQNAC